MKKMWAKRKNVVVKVTTKSKNPPLVSENHRAHIPVRYRALSIVLMRRNNLLPPFCCSHAESSCRDSGEESALEETPSDIAGDGESASMNEDTDEEQQEVC